MRAWLSLLGTVRKQHQTIERLEALVNQWESLYRDRQADNMALVLQLDEARDELDDLRRLSGWLSQ